MWRLGVVLLLGGVVAAGCAAQEVQEEMEVAPLVLGPTDGHDLPGVDLERVQAGQMAPDFTLESLGGPWATLSDFRGEKNVVLVFYRGHW
jgi:hypothetical protein